MLAFLGGITAQASILEDYIFIKRYGGILKDYEMLNFISKKENIDQLFKNLSGQIFLDPLRFQLLETILSDFIIDPNNCLWKDEKWEMIYLNDGS